MKMGAGGYIDAQALDRDDCCQLREFDSSTGRQDSFRLLQFKPDVASVGVEPELAGTFATD